MSSIVTDFQIEKRITQTTLLWHATKLRKFVAPFNDLSTAKFSNIVYVVRIPPSTTFCIVVDLDDLISQKLPINIRSNDYSEVVVHK
jgi:hypothetical protein